MEAVKNIFETDDLLVVNKPAGMTVTKEGTTKVETLEDWLELHYPKSASLHRHGIVHRLDKGTSGIVVVAKDTETMDYLQLQFKTRKVVKRYLALVRGDVSRQGDINAPIGRHELFGRWRVKPEGKNALTSFELVQKYSYHGRTFSLVAVTLKTGRTHQIRVHFSYLGWPLVGDRNYGGDMSLGLERPFLAAVYLELVLKSGEKLVFEAPPAPDLLLFLERLDAA